MIGLMGPSVLARLKGGRIGMVDAVLASRGNDARHALLVIGRLSFFALLTGIRFFFLDFWVWADRFLYNIPVSIIELTRWS